MTLAICGHCWLMKLFEQKLTGTLNIVLAGEL